MKTTIKIKAIAGLTFLACHVFACGVFADPGGSQAWQTFLREKQTGGPTTLPDYSYAGYGLAGSEPEQADLPIFNVTDYGAKPDDNQSDRRAVEAAIADASKNGGGIILFPPGRFLMNEQDGRTAGIEINADHIILRGAGSGPGGTELYMRHHLDPTNPSKMWSTPKLFTFHLPPEKNVRPTLAKVIGKSPRETFAIEVDDTSQIKVGDYVILHSQDPDALPGLLAGLEPWDIWASTIKNGIRISGEKHRVERIEGNRLIFAEPIHIDIDPRYGWTVAASPFGVGWGVEDITFRGEAPAPFVHHKDAVYDSGWGFLEFVRGEYPYVRRCRFTNSSISVTFSACYGATAINCAIEGNRGHDAIISGYYSYGTLIAFCLDDSDGGTFHGYAANQGAVGTVIYRCKSSDRGLDWHASGPYATLIDASHGGLIGCGGSHLLLPNHLQYLTLWNYEQTAGEVYKNLNWWEPRVGKERYGMAKVVKPTIVGFHGLPTTFLESSCQLVESYGTPVQPESLFEAQLKLRLGRIPAWIDEGKHLYDRYQSTGHF